MTGVGIFAIINDPLSLLSYVWLVFGALQTGTAWDNKKRPYLIIEDNKLTKHTIFSHTIEIDEVRKVRKFVNSFKIETLDKTLTIDKNVMEPESLYRLTDFLNGLELNGFEMEGKRA